MKGLESKTKEETWERWRRLAFQCLAFTRNESVEKIQQGRAEKKTVLFFLSRGFLCLI